jgi:hypothetical protein
MKMLIADIEDDSEEDDEEDDQSDAEGQEIFVFMTKI